MSGDADHGPRAADDEERAFAKFLVTLNGRCERSRAHKPTIGYSGTSRRWLSSGKISQLVMGEDVNMTQGGSDMQLGA